MKSTPSASVRGALWVGVGRDWRFTGVMSHKPTSNAAYGPAWKNEPTQADPDAIGCAYTVRRRRAFPFDPCRLR